MQRIVHARSWRGIALIALVTAGATAAATGASAGSTTDCDTAYRGGLNLSVSAGARGSRRVMLGEGDTVTLKVTTRTQASLAVSGDGADRTLHTGRAATVYFVAPRAASYAFRLNADSGSGAALALNCRSVARVDSERALIARRKAFVTETDPDRMRIDRPRGELNPFGTTGQEMSATDDAPRDITASVSLSELTAAMNPGQKHDPGILDFWFEGRHLNYDTVDLQARDAAGNASVLYFGSKYMLGPDIMLGAMAQFDQAAESGGVSASGWMAGPYMSVRFGHGIIFDGRAAWGVANNLPKGIAVDMASADRSLVRGTLRGTREIGGWTFAPSAGLTYVEDTMDPHTAAYLETQAPTGSGRLNVLPEVKRRFELDSTTYVEPRIAAGGFLAFDDLAKLTPGNLTGQDQDLNWKAEAGVSVGVKDSVNLQATGGVETSAGQSGPENWSGRLRLNMPLGK